MNTSTRPSGLDALKRFRVHVAILADTTFAEWLVALSQGTQAQAPLTEEFAALVEAAGIARQSPAGWMLSPEGRQFARDLDLIPEPAIAEVAYASRERISRPRRRSPSDSVQVRRFNEPAQLARAWTEFVATRDESLRNALVEHYLFLVSYHAQRIASIMPEEADVDDLRSAGVFGLVDAIQSFDPERGIKFETYASSRIRGAMLDDLRSMTALPSLARERARRTSARSTETDEQRALAESAERNFVPRLLNKIRRSMSGPKQAGAELSEPEKHADRELLHEFLEQHLTVSERWLIILYYYECNTMREIASTLGISESRAYRMHMDVIDRMRALLAQRAVSE